MKKILRKNINGLISRFLWYIQVFEKSQSFYLFGDRQGRARRHAQTAHRSVVPRAGASSRNRRNAAHGRSRKEKPARRFI